MSIHLLGYSESTLSRIMAILKASNCDEDIVIVQNMEVPEEVAFCPPGMKYKKIFYNQWQPDLQKDKYMLAVMKPASKKIVFDFFQQHCGLNQSGYKSIQHPTAIIDSTVTIGNGCVVEPISVIASFARLGFGVYVNRGCTIGHHTVLEDFVSINPGVHVAGHCIVGEGVQIGIGTVVFDHIRIGANSIIGGGSVVTKNIPDNVIAWGNPCKVIKQIER
jgi:sugar O-acyltransferase (sialic acid O-acetyltransferase NeuD family)